MDMINDNGLVKRNLLIATTPYVLMIYLLYQSKEETEHTAFFLGPDISRSVKRQLPNCVEVDKIERQHPHVHIWDRLSYARRQEKWMLRRMPFVATAKIYGVDYLDFSETFLAKRRMCVIEDGYSFYRADLQRHRPWWARLFRRLTGMLNGPFGRGSHCDAVIYTGLMDLRLPGKKLIKIDPCELWRADSRRQRFIASLFGVTPDDLLLFKGKDVILITQPIEELGHISEREKIDIYARALSPYAPSRVVIKRHPRETTDYALFFSDMTCFTKPIPLEILSFMGVRFHTAITYCSTAIYTFNYDLERVILLNDFKHH